MKVAPGTASGNAKPDATSDLLRPREAAALIGVARTSLYRLIREEGLPVLVLSVTSAGRGVLRFRSDELQEWLDGRRERKLKDWSRYRRRRDEADGR